MSRWRVLCKTADFVEWQYCGVACSKSMTAGGPYFRQVAASAIGCWQQAFEGGRRRSLSSREGSPGANSAKAVFLSVLTQRHLRIILGTFGRYRQQPFDTHSVPVCTVCSHKQPWSSPKNFRFRRCRRSNLDQNLPRITNPVSDLTGDQYHGTQ